MPSPGSSETQLPPVLPNLRPDQRQVSIRVPPLYRPHCSHSLLLSTTPAMRCLIWFWHQSWLAFVLPTRLLCCSLQFRRQICYCRCRHRRHRRRRQLVDLWTNLSLRSVAVSNCCRTSVYHQHHCYCCCCCHQSPHWPIPTRRQCSRHLRRPAPDSWGRSWVPKSRMGRLAREVHS